MLETQAGQRFVKKAVAAVVIGAGSLLALWGLGQYVQENGAGVLAIVVGVLVVLIGAGLWKQA